MENGCKDITRVDRRLGVPPIQPRSNSRNPAGEEQFFARLSCCYQASLALLVVMRIPE